MSILEGINSPEQLKGMPLEELKKLCAEIRAALIETVAHNGGHLSSNLGAVELTVALHTVFEAPQDKIVFDVGHQAYVHKMLTGRYAQFGSLRKSGGVSGFPRMGESRYDAFSVGHASTAISAALGMARARDLMGGKNSVVAVVGDGALTGGMCYEALNDAGQSRTRLIVILNDNEMSISRNVGALSGYLTGLRQSSPYKQFKRGVRGGLNRMPLFGDRLFHVAEKLRDSVRSLFLDGQFFEALGFEYQGPIDGHDLKRLMQVLSRARAADRPVLIHVVTQKGKGYVHAEHHPDSFHGVAPFYVDTGNRIGKSELSNGSIMASELCAMAQNDVRVCAITAAMPTGTSLSMFKERFPDRFFDVGIAEEHAITMAAGMAAAGLRPYVAIYSSFAQRAYDQLMTDVCLESLPVVLLLDRAGLVGPDGATHQGVFDLSYLRAMPNMVVGAPRDVRDLRRFMRLSRTLNGPIAIRYARDTEDMGPHMQELAPLKVGEWERLTSGADVTFLAAGRMVETALNASIELEGKGVHAGVIDARFIKPMDEKLLREAGEQGALVVTLEENSLLGGLGSGVLEAFSQMGLRVNTLTLGVPDRFIEQGSVAEQLEWVGLTPHAVARRVLAALGK